MLHCIQNRICHLLNDVILFNPLKGGLFLSKNKCTENSSNCIFQHLYYILPKKQFSALLNKGLGSGVKTSFRGYLIQPVFNTLREVAKTQAAEGKGNVVGHA